MKIAGALLCAGCITVMLAVLAIGTASAAVVPFGGVEYSWLHHGDDGPVADWIKRINDIVAVRNGDLMQFQNRWYNNYAGTADIKVSYGGERPGICGGNDPYVSYGLNYGNYYPSSKESEPMYVQVLACNQTPRSLLVSHQYVYNGISYGTINPDNDYTMLFQWRYGTDEAPPTDTEASPTPTAIPTATPTATPTGTATVTPTPTATARPSATTTPVPLPSASAPSPGFGFGQVIALISVLAVAYAGYRVTSKR